MGRSTFTGPLLSGTVRDGQYRNVGNSVQAQSATITQNSTNAVSATFYLPATSQMIRITPDVLTAFDSATSAVLTVGVTAGGTQYVTTADMKVAGRASITFSAAQLLAMSSTAQDNTATAAAGAPISTVVATITPTGATTAGLVRITIEYIQANPQGAAV